MTPESETDRYSRLLNQYGEPMTIRVFSTGGASRTYTDNASCLGWVRRYQPEELAGTIMQGDVEVIVLASDITTPPKNEDMVIVRSRNLTIRGVDDNTRRIQGVLIAYSLHCRGI